MPSLPSPEVPWKPRVITVHGVGCLGFGGEWQEKVESVLGEQFVFDHIRHGYYRWLAGVDLAFEPVVVLALFGLWWWIRPVWPHDIRPEPLVVLVFVLAYYLRTVRHKLAWWSFWNQLFDRLIGHGPPHLIAHSLGTYLTCRAMTEKDFARFDHVILAGSVVNEEFCEQRWIASRPTPCQNLRNEVAPRDPVVIIAFLFRKLFPNRLFGGSGYSGFAGGPNLVHTVNAPELPCPSCSSMTAPIHNLFYRHVYHGGKLTDANHAAIYWLPYLLASNPQLFSNFLSIVVKAKEADVNRDFVDLRFRLLSLRKSSWGEGSQTLEDALRHHFRKLLPYGRPPTASQLDAGVIFTYQAILKSHGAVENSNYPDRQVWLRCLRTSVAVEFAVRQAIAHGIR